MSTVRAYLEAIQDRNAEKPDRGRTINEINDEADAMAALLIIKDAERMTDHGNDRGHPDYVAIYDPVGCGNAEEPK